MMRDFPLTSTTSSKGIVRSSAAGCSGARLERRPAGPRDKLRALANLQYPSQPVKLMRYIEVLERASAERRSLTFFRCRLEMCRRRLPMWAS